MIRCKYCNEQIKPHRVYRELAQPENANQSDIIYCNRDCRELDDLKTKTNEYNIYKGVKDLILNPEAGVSITNSGSYNAIIITDRVGVEIARYSVKSNIDEVKQKFNAVYTELNNDQNKAKRDKIFAFLGSK